jgi:hypothetical protein
MTLAVLLIGFDAAAVPGEDSDAVATASAAGRQRAEDLVGAGLRADPLLLELAVEATRRLVPNAPIAFDTSRADSADAALRAVALLNEIDDRLSAFSWPRRRAFGHGPDRSRVAPPLSRCGLGLRSGPSRTRSSGGCRPSG